MQIIHILISDALWIAALVSFIASFILMNNVKVKVPEGQQDQSPLTSQERNYVLLMTIFSPILSSSVFYYGWKKKLPVKAKAANNWGWLGFFISILIWVGLGFI
jgi:MFS-type transporter involved in bile tolerance (Atg22 family)